MKIRTHIIIIVLMLAINIGKCPAQIHSIDLRSDLPSWILLSPGIGADINWNQRWSAGISGSYAHWHLSGKGHFPRISVAEATIRRYGKGEAAFKGFYLGANIGMQWYDINPKHHKGWNGKNLAAGVLAGYTLLLPSNWAFDAGLGLGYLYRDYKRFEWYSPANKDRIINSHKGSAFGITHLSIAVIYRFKCK